MFTLKALFVTFAVCFVATSVASARRGPMVGGQTELTGEKREAAVQTLSNSLKKLAAGPGPSFKVSKVDSVTSQIVSGVVYRYHVQLQEEDKEAKPCTAEIWSQPWMPNGNELTLKCQNAEPVVFRHD